jgi:hypothetical protein
MIDVFPVLPDASSRQKRNARLEESADERGPAHSQPPDIGITALFASAASSAEKKPPELTLGRVISALHAVLEALGKRHEFVGRFGFAVASVAPPADFNLGGVHGGSGHLHGCAGGCGVGGA